MLITINNDNKSLLIIVYYVHMAPGDHPQRRLSIRPTPATWPVQRQPGSRANLSNPPRQKSLAVSKNGLVPWNTQVSEIYPLVIYQRVPFIVVDIHQ
jgi:hypothetical protein